MTGLRRDLEGVALAFLLALPLSAQGADPSPDAQRLGSPMALPAGESNASMWPAPTAEDWAKPVTIPWERTFDDALAVARETGQPILACVNMDGEVASEHWAGVRYRDPETAKLLEPYVCVIGSVYRHTPRDFDAAGNRVECPRFGHVTCGEHIAIETLLYDRYLDGKRISPRHILLELDGTKTYDVYYTWDVATVVTAYRVGAENRPPPRPRAGHDLPVPERVTSRDSRDRDAIERLYRTGTREERRTLIESTIRQKEVDQVDLLRLAIFGLDLDLARLARRALLQCQTEAAVDLIAEVLKTPLEPAEREELLAAAERLAEQYPRARTLIATQKGLAGRSQLVDVAQWKDSAHGAGGTYGPGNSIETRARSAETQPADPDAQLALAVALLDRAHDPATDRRYVPLLIEDAGRAAVQAGALGATGWKAEALQAFAADARDDRDSALAHARAAVEAGLPPPGASDLDERTTLRVLALFAQARQRQISQAYSRRRPWPPEWLADVTSTYTVLCEHPLATEENFADGHDFLRWLGATPRAVQFLDQGLARFPESWLLHARLRDRLLWEGGPEALEQGYAQRLAAAEAPGALRWFAGYAALVAAEHHRRAGETEAAQASYDHALEHYARDLDEHPDHAATIPHYVALAQAGRARLALEQADLDRAATDILASFDTDPQAAGSLDGLHLTPADTAKQLLARAGEAGRDDLVARVQAALDRLDPALVAEPDYLQTGADRVRRRRGQQ
jgi:hypothetical protein